MHPVTGCWMAYITRNQRRETDRWCGKDQHLVPSDRVVNESVSGEQRPS